MSDLGQQIQQEIDDIKALQTKSQTPAGQDGDPWATQYEAFVDAIQRQLDAAATQTALDGKPDSDTQLSNQEVAAALVAQSILDEQGAVTAGVDNSKTVSDVGQLGELSVSDSQPVTAGPVGDGGEWVPLEVFSYGRSTSFSTTSTTYEQVTTYRDYPIVDYGQISLTNVNQLGRSLVGSTAQRGGTSDDVYVRLVGGSPEISGVGPASSSIVSTNATGVDFEHLEMKVDGGEGEAFGLSLVLWGQIS